MEEVTNNALLVDKAGFADVKILFEVMKSDWFSDKTQRLCVKDALVVAKNELPVVE